MELHFVHSFKDGQEDMHEDYKEVLAVVGVFFEIAEKSHPFIEKLQLKKLKKIEKLHFNDLLVDGAHFEEI